MGKIAPGPPSLAEQDIVTLDGPVGITHDFEASSPLLTASTFIIDQLPPTLLGQLHKKTPPPWFMAKIQLRRVLAPGSLRLPVAVPAPEDTWASPWTAPEWIQFLPDSRNLTPASWNIAQGCALSVNAANYQAQGWQEPALDGKIDPSFFDYWLLITQVVCDVRGKEQELYVATLGRTGMVNPGVVDTNFSILDGKISQSGSPLRLRVMQLRLSPNGHPPAIAGFRAAILIALSLPSSPYTLIFGQPDDDGDAVRDDAQAQIIGLSDPIPATIQ